MNHVRISILDPAIEISAIFSYIILPSLTTVTHYSRDLSLNPYMCFQGFWVTDLSGKICILIFVVNNKYCFKRFLSSIYLLNFDMDLVNSINTKPLRLTIMSNPRKYGFRERAKFKILWFDD